MNRCDPIIHYSELAKFPERCHEYCYSRCARRTRLFGCLHIVYAVDPAVVVIETRSVSAATAHDVSVCYPGTYLVLGIVVLSVASHLIDTYLDTLQGPMATRVFIGLGIVVIIMGVIGI